MNLSESLLHALKQHGATEIFGIPGDFALPFFKIIEQSNILPYYTFSHEPAVGFAADVSARLRSSLGVAVVTYGAGAFNMVNAVACAYAEKSPLVVISGAPGTAEGGSGLLLHHQAKTLNSQLNVYREITCDQAVLDDAKTAPEMIARVLRSCLEHSRPVYIEIPRDMVAVETTSVPTLTPTPSHKDALDACATELLNALQQAETPHILAGVEVRRYDLEAKVARLSQRLHLPIAVSFMGRGLFADTPCHLLGSYIGMAGDPEICQQIESADCLLMLGVILCDTNFGVSEQKLDMRRVINASDRQVKFGFHIYPDITLVDLIDTLLEKTAELPSTPAMPISHQYPRQLVKDEQPIRPQDIACAVNDLFDQYQPMPIASDIGDCLFTAMEIDNTALVAPGYYATMGFGVPGGMGLQVATQQRPLILVGDGAFQMTGWELGNCRRFGVDPIILLFNNQAWGMLKTFQPDTGYNRLDTWGFAEMAEPLGGHGTRVTTRQALADALSHAVQQRGKFQLIEIMLSDEEISPTLQRFVDAQCRLTGMQRG